MFVWQCRQTVIDERHPSALDDCRHVATHCHADQVRPTGMFRHAHDTRRAPHVVNPPAPRHAPDFSNLGFLEAAIARDEALLKADRSRALTPRVSNRGCREAHGVVRCRWHADVREGDTDVADEGPPHMKTAETVAEANALAGGAAISRLLSSGRLLATNGPSTRRVCGISLSRGRVEAARKRQPGGARRHTFTASILGD